MFTYEHNGTDRQRAEIEEAVGEMLVAATVELARDHPNKPQEVSYGGYVFSVTYELADYTPLEEIGLNFRQEKFGRYEFYYTGYDRLFVTARPWDYSFSRLASYVDETVHREESAVYFTVQEAEAIGKFFDLNFPRWRTPYDYDNGDHDWYAQAMVKEYGDEAWGWSYEQEARW